MKLARATFLGVRGLSDATLDLADPGEQRPRDLVVLAGASGAGKTRALEAIVAAKEVIGAYGSAASGAAWVMPGALSARVALTFWLDERERALASSQSAVAEAEVTFGAHRNTRAASDGLAAVLARYQHAGRAGKVEYFAASRRLPSHGPFGGTSALEQRIVRGTKDARKYSFIPRFLRDLEGDAPRAARFAAALAALSPTLRYEAAPSDGLPRCLRSRGAPPATPMEISDAEADAVLFAATAVAIDLSSSLVLVDRPELYADAARLGELVAGLASLGDDNQLVLATSSTALCEAAPAARVVRLIGGRG